MKLRPSPLLVMLGFLAIEVAGLSQNGESPMSADPDAPADDIKGESLRLIQQDIKAGALRPKPPANAKGGPGPVLLLAPVIVKGRAIPVVVIPHYESRIQKFFKSGILWGGSGGGSTGILSLTQTQSTPGSPKRPSPKLEISISLFSW
jgi:hypothetical protein